MTEGKKEDLSYTRLSDHEFWRKGREDSTSEEPKQEPREKAVELPPSADERRERIKEILKVCREKHISINTIAVYDKIEKIVKEIYPSLTQGTLTSYARSAMTVLKLEKEREKRWERWF